MLDFRKVNKEKPQEQKIKYTHTPIQEIRSINKQVEVKESSKIRATPMRDLQSYIHLDDIKKLLWIAKADNDRNYLIILTLFLTGRRISEVLMLKQKAWGLDKELLPTTMTKVKTIIQDARYMCCNGSTIKAIQKTVSRIESFSETPSKGRSAGPYA